MRRLSVCLNYVRTVPYCIQQIMLMTAIYWHKLKLNSVALVRERTIPTERPPPVGEVSANFLCGSILNILKTILYTTNHVNGSNLLACGSILNILKTTLYTTNHVNGSNLLACGSILNILKRCL